MTKLQDNADIVHEFLDKGWEAQAQTIARITGLSYAQTNAALKHLIGYGHVIRIGHSAPFSYRLKE